MTKLREMFTAWLTLLTRWLAVRLGFYLIEERRYRTACIELHELLRYTERSGFLAEDHKAKRRVQRAVGAALIQVHPPAFVEAAGILLGLEDEVQQLARSA